MVEGATAVLVSWCGRLVAQAERMQITRLDPAARARIIGSLVLLTIGGVALVVLCWMALRVGRRYVLRADLPAARRTPSSDDWANKPLFDKNPREDGFEPDDNRRDRGHQS